MSSFFLEFVWWAKMNNLMIFLSVVNSCEERLNICSEKNREKNRYIFFPFDTPGSAHIVKRFNNLMRNPFANLIACFHLV